MTPWVTQRILLYDDVAEHRFNSATAVTPWVTLLDKLRTDEVAVLQFGHGGDAVGDQPRPVANPTEHPVASIRPRR